MAAQVHEPSRIGDKEGERKWIPIVVPLSAATFVALIFLAMWFVLYRP